MAALSAIASIGASAVAAPARFEQRGTTFTSVREVSVPRGSGIDVVVTEFLHHGQIAADGANLVVLADDDRAARHRILQLGPGDFCRLAFQPLEGETDYAIYYGGDPPSQDSPPWQPAGPLLLETRRYENCNLNSLSSIEDAFEKAAPIGADYVTGIHHRYNPFASAPAPFLSRYRGTLMIPKTGKYRFFTVSQDASFFLIDGKLVTSSPGRHGPDRRARPDVTGEVRLEAGPHEIEYHHAAASSAATMALAWEPPPLEAKPKKPATIPPALLGAERVLRLRPGPVVMRDAATVPDFLVEIRGEVPLPDDPDPLIGVQMMNRTPAGSGRMTWDFGDGQSSNQRDPRHIYLRPGVYTVRLTLSLAGGDVTTANRVQIHRPWILDKEDHHYFTQYFPMVETYDPATLDAPSVDQLIDVFLFRIDYLMDDRSDPIGTEVEGSEPDEDSPSMSEAERTARRAAARPFYRRIVEIAQSALAPSSASKEDVVLVEVARRAARIARDTLDDSQAAGALWHTATRKLREPRPRATAAIAAADVAVNDLLRPDTAAPYLEMAGELLDDSETGEIAVAWHLVRGDDFAARGDGDQARRAYRSAADAVDSERNLAERTAWRGAYSRSTEEFLQRGDLQPAIDQLRQWRHTFPTDMIGGYLPLLMARYHAAREAYDRAVAMADRLLVVNPDSPYIDRLLLLSAECDRKRGNHRRAIATLESIVSDYPGSPVVAEAQRQLRALQGDANR